MRNFGATARTWRAEFRSDCTTEDFKAEEDEDEEEDEEEEVEEEEEEDLGKKILLGGHALHKNRSNRRKHCFYINTKRQRKGISSVPKSTECYRDVNLILCQGISAVTRHRAMTELRETSHSLHGLHTDQNRT